MHDNRHHGLSVESLRSQLAMSTRPMPTLTRRTKIKRIPAPDGQIPGRVHRHSSSAGSSLPDSLKEALDDDDNILVSMHYPKLAQEYWQSIEDKKAQVEVMVCRLLRTQWCHMLPKEM